MNYTQQEMNWVYSVLAELNHESPQCCNGEYYINISVDPGMHHTIQLRLVQCPDVGLVMCFGVEVAYVLHTTVHRIATQVQSRLHSVYVKQCDNSTDLDLLSMLACISVAAIPYDLINGGSAAQAAAYASARLNSAIGTPSVSNFSLNTTGPVSDVKVSLWMPVYGKTGGHHAEYAVRDIANCTSPHRQLSDLVGQACSWMRPLTSWTLTQSWYLDDDTFRMPMHLWLLSPNGNSKEAEWAWAHRMPGHNAYECQYESCLDGNKLTNLALVALDVLMLAQPNINIQESPGANSFAMLCSIELEFDGERWAVAIHNSEIAMKKFITADRKQSKTHLFKVRKVD